MMSLEMSFMSVGQRQVINSLIQISIKQSSLNFHFFHVFAAPLHPCIVVTSSYLITDDWLAAFVQELLNYLAFLSAEVWVIVGLNLISGGSLK